MGRVAVLNEALINQIAAGEVVERPASVVKELGENALDAKARQVRVQVRGGGLELLAVSDDGIGMSREDAVLCVQRYATSKLRDLEGLSAIATLGFRGEALAAIAAVSRFSLTTSEAEAKVGTRVELEGGGSLSVGDAPAAGGTEIRVEELFFNTPARRKFLRRAETELKHVEEAVVRLSLAHEEVGFTLEEDGRVLWSVRPGAPLRERLIAALGPELEPHLVEVSAERLGLRVRGVVASPELTFPNARGLYTFVNGRYVRDRQLTFAIQRAFGQSLPPGRQPVGAVFVELDPHEVDVNVHPQKLEVRFRDGRIVAEAVQAAIARALHGAAEQAAPPPAVELHYASAVERFLRQAELGGGAPLPALSLGDAPRGFGQARPTINEAPPPGYFARLRFVGLLARRFWLCEAPGALAVLDSHAALERLTRSGLEAPPGEQGSLFTRVVELPATEASRVLDRLAGFAALGIRIEPFGGSAFSVRQAPPALADADWKSVLAELAQLLPEGSAPDPEQQARAKAALACHGATPLGAPSGHAEVERVLRELDGCDFGLPCTHGKVVLHELPLLELERLAGARI